MRSRHEDRQRRTRRLLRDVEELSAIANTGSIERVPALWPSPSSTRDTNPGRRPEHCLQGRRLRPHGSTERGSPTWYRTLDEGPVVATGLDDGVHHARHLGGDRGQRLAPQVGVVPVPRVAVLRQLGPAAGRARLLGREVEPAELQELAVMAEAPFLPSPVCACNHPRSCSQSEGVSCSH